ncbi:MAG: alanine racemase [Butyrivibrio sp.]|nr:alanine racemase [Muribaculum sp.]MCM1552572.1 alanine racemase [Butyrivibrio sp.]
MNNKDSGFGIEDKFQRICAKVDLDAILHNVEQMREGLREDTRMIAVIKTDGYGHGSIPIAHCLEPLDYLFGFAVATPEEAYVLREHGVRKPILVLGYTFPYAQERMAREEIRSTIFNLDRSELRELAGIGRAQGKPVRVHIKVDTGMGRIGVTPDDEGLAFVREVMECAADGGLEIEGIFTHFARADERDQTNVRKQLALFTDFLSRVKSELCLDIPLCHCANSAALMELPETNMDAVRAGISLYGLHPSSEVPGEGSYLRPALSLSSHIVHVKTIHAGQSVSYGGTFTAGRDMRVATIPVGYGDGYPRSLSGGRGYVLIRGQRAPILGRVCMDQFMADVSDIPEVIRGESVILLGEDGDERITAEMLGELSGRFNYELVCDLGKRVPRVFYRGGRHVACQDMDGYRTIAANDLCRLQ